MLHSSNSTLIKGPMYSQGVIKQSQSEGGGRGGVVPFLALTPPEEVNNRSKGC